jgi:hypothetical protein
MHLPRLAALLAVTLGAAHAEAKGDGPRWAGSSIGVSNTVSALTLDPSAEPDYNPFYAVSVSLAPRWRFTSWLSMSAAVAATHEITDADGHTYQNETRLSDTTLSIGVSGVEVPGLGIDVTGGLKAIFPTSLGSRAQTLQVGLSPSLGLSKRFGLLEGLTLGYGAALRVNAHEYTTSAREAPLIASCRGIECVEFLNTGVRNSQFLTQNSFSVSLGLTTWLGLSTSLGVYTSHLYPGQTAPEVSLVPVAPTDTRYLVRYGLGARVGPFAGLTTSIGASAFSPQRAPNADYYAPYFNRYTQLTIDLSFDLSKLVSSEDKG